MMLILAAVLMTSATVYGVVEYRNRSSQKDFRELYTPEKKEESTIQPVEPAAEDKKVAVPVPSAKKESRKEAALVVKNETANMKKAHAVEKKKKKTQKKLRLKMFSRSAPGEEIRIQ